MQLQKGQRMKLSDLTSFRDLTVSLKMNMTSGTADVTCFGIDAMDQLSDDRYFIFYNQTSSPEQAIRMETTGDTTQFYLSLDRLPATIKKLVFTVTNENGMPVTSIRQGQIQIKAQGNIVAECNFEGHSFQQERAIILSELYVRNEIWRVSSVLSGFDGGLSALLAHYGGEEAAPSEPAPTEPEPVRKPEIPVSPAPKTVVNLKKPGDVHNINLTKNNSRLHVNLNWNQNTKKGLFGGLKSMDLDLACLYRLKDGSIGIVQALGNSFGNETQPPYIKLDQDDRSGASTNGENMFFSKPDSIELAVVFAYIYSGAANWQSTDARVILKQAGEPDISIQLDSSYSNDRFCVIAVMEDFYGQLQIRREEKYFSGHVAIDNFYGFGLRWHSASK